MVGFECNSMVPSVIFMILYDFFAYVYVIIYCWLGIFTSMGIINFIIFFLLWINLFVNYLKSVKTDPGRVPENWKDLSTQNKSSETSPELNLIEIPPPSINDSKYCKQCKLFKPPRTHHCSECNRCVLKMDHHCPWINNCVGHYNHKYFLLFLVYIILLGCYVISVYVFWFIDNIKTRNPKEDVPTSPLQFILTIFHFLVIVPTFFGVGCLLNFQINLVFRNVTTIESFAADMEEYQAQKKGKTFRHIYDQGALNNLKQVCGESYISWLVSSSPQSDGLNWETFKNLDV